MIVPQFWAEGRVQDRRRGKQVTVRRFGWSDSGQEEAQASADGRAQDALRRLLAGEVLPRREPKIPYNGAQGVPIREEIVSRHGETIVTRNSYGARCLNTPNVFFADVDFPEKWQNGLTLVVSLFGLAAAALAAWLTNSRIVGGIVAGVTIVFAGVIATFIQRARKQTSGDAETAARKRVQTFVAAHPGWHLRVYRTPAGLRLLAMHQTFEPTDVTVAESFRSLGVDPIYAVMCFNQQCFRARVSPKPWRIGISAHLKPSPGVWPVSPERRPMRQQWIDQYESAAGDYASCTFLESLGDGAINAEAKQVQELHDELGRATSPLPIA